MKTKGAEADIEHIRVVRSRLGPGMYRISPDTFEGFHLKMEGEECSLGAALDRLYGAEPDDPDAWEVRGFEGDIYVSGDSEVRVEGDLHELRILSELLELTRKGVKPRYATWFLFSQNYDSDTFFVHYGGKIVDEHYYFYSELPQIFSKGCIIGDSDSNHDWFGISCPDGVDEAFARYWYRRFYTETLTGQLMVLNPEHPPLYYYSRNRRTGNLTQQDARVLLNAFMLVLLRMLGCVIFLLAAIAIPNALLRRVSLGIACVCAVPLVVASWQVYWKRGNGKDWMEWWLAYSDADTSTEEKHVSGACELAKKKPFTESAWFYFLIVIVGIAAIWGLSRLQ